MESIEMTREERIELLINRKLNDIIIMGNIVKEDDLSLEVIDVEPDYYEGCIFLIKLQDMDNGNTIAVKLDASGFVLTIKHCF